MKALRITILFLIGIVSLVSVNQIMFQVPTQLALGSVAILFLVVVITFGFPNLQNRLLFFRPAVGMIVCLLLQFALITQIPRNQSWLIYSGLEIVLILIVFGLANKTNKSLQQLDAMSGSTAVTDIPTLDQAETAVHNEITRSRHYERPLAIIVFRFNNSQANKLSLNLQQDFINQSTVHQARQIELISHLRNQMQCYHQLIRDSKNDTFYLVCPELTYALAEEIGQQISETLTNQINETVHYGSASFPKDGFTFNKIRKEALKRIDTKQSSVNQKSNHNRYQSLSA